MNNLSYTLFGIIAVLVGFCTWASIRLRAARIKAIRDQATNELLKADLATANIRAKEWAAEAARLRDNAVTMADMTAEYKVKSESLQTEVDIAHNSVSDLIKKVVALEHSQFKLVESIRHTGIRNSKGVVKKATEAQINEMLGKVVSAVELTPSLPTRDWNVPQAFPRDYIIPIGTSVEIAIGDGVKIGTKGVIVRHESSANVFKYGLTEQRFNSCVFAPVNPTDHPEHPQFGKKKLRDIKSMNKEAILMEDKVTMISLLLKSEKEGIKWANGHNPTSWNPALPFPYCLCYGYDNEDNLQVSDEKFYNSKGYNTIPASLFI